MAWLRVAARLKAFSVGYPHRLPRGSLYYRCYLPSYGWLSIPLRRDLRRSPWQVTWPFMSTWKAYHFKVLQSLYGKAPFFLEWKPFLEEIYLTSHYQTLVQVAWRIIDEIALWYGWKVSLCKSETITPLSLDAEPIVSSLDVLLKVGFPSGSL